MNLDKAKKRIAKQVKRGFHGFPQVSIEYFGVTSDSADEVVIAFTLEEGSDPQRQTFKSNADAREDEAIQSMLVKIIERSNASTVTENRAVSTLK